MTETQVISTYDTKTHFSQILSQVEKENIEVIVTRHEKPVAKIVPFNDERLPRIPGAWKGRMEIPERWDEFTQTDEQNWYGGR